jgi:hypothetical protein
VNQTFEYDRLGNIVAMADSRDAAKWPDGAKPTAIKTIDHDSQYRVVGVDAAHGNDAFVSPFAAELAAGDTRPVPHQSFGARSTAQRFGYDGLGNLLGDVQPPSQTIYDRGLSDVLIGHNATEALDKPNQLLGAGPDWTNDIAVHYDAAGNMVALDMQRPSTQCLAAGKKCSQRFLYEWDEVNQLARVRRWDYATLQGQPVYPTPPADAVAAELRFAYSAGARVLKHEVNAHADDRYTVDVFDSLRLSRTTFDA